MYWSTCLSTSIWGFNLSGTDSKAGGRDYLLLFMQAKTIATKIKVSSKN